MKTTKKLAEAAVLCEEYVSDHPGCLLKDLQAYVMKETGLKLEAVKRARKMSRVDAVRKKGGFCCWLKDPAGEEIRRLTIEVPPPEWREILRKFRMGRVEFLIVPAGAEVSVDGVVV